jgi:hypothetical protein
MNLRPSDGGVSRKAPEDVKDPVLRAKYMKMIAENNALSEAQTKHIGLRRIFQALAGFINIKEENLKTVRSLESRHQNQRGSQRVDESHGPSCCRKRDEEVRLDQVRQNTEHP